MCLKIKHTSRLAFSDALNPAFKTERDARHKLKNRGSNDVFWEEIVAFNFLLTSLCQSASFTRRISAHICVSPCSPLPTSRLNSSSKTQNSLGKLFFAKRHTLYKMFWLEERNHP
ncbi:hypothetical protein CEXT_280201 [Caerostris extrusa]|uniref:Uncharacterized protein n=1 Tax=Caerostris extrusa TaxID=172846 RepID=A0AAV4NHD3_CAEEX|nr:hypothetical protein CEXT_280201 [Caerostris extrusa]